MDPENHNPDSRHGGLTAFTERVGRLGKRFNTTTFGKKSFLSKLMAKKKPKSNPPNDLSPRTLYSSNSITRHRQNIPKEWLYGAEEPYTGPSQAAVPIEDIHSGMQSPNSLRPPSMIPLHASRPTKDNIAKVNGLIRANKENEVMDDKCTKPTITLFDQCYAEHRKGKETLKIPVIPPGSSLRPKPTIRAIPNGSGMSDDSTSKTLASGRVVRPINKDCPPIPQQISVPNAAGDRDDNPDIPNWTTTCAMPQTAQVHPQVLKRTKITWSWTSEEHPAVHQRDEQPCGPPHCIFC